MQGQHLGCPAGVKMTREANDIMNTGSERHNCMKD